MTDPVTAEWERCRHYIEDALEYSPGHETIEDIERMLGEGSYMLWTGAECALVTRLVTYSNKKVMEVMHGGGNKREIIERLGPVLEDFAISQGCDSMEVIGRKGWERDGLRHGWRLGYICMIRELKH